jgi:hypothetical protein
MSMNLQAFIQRMSDDKKLEQEFSAAKLKELILMPPQTQFELGFSSEHIAATLANVAAGRNGKRWVEKLPHLKGKYRLTTDSADLPQLTSPKPKPMAAKSQLENLEPESWSVNAERVRGFIEWITAKEQKLSFDFKYDVNTKKRRNTLYAKNIAAAAQAYSWPSTSIPEELVGHIAGFPYRATNLLDTVNLLTVLRNELKQSLADSDSLRHWKACWAILHWGGVTAPSNLEFYALRFIAGNLITYNRAAHNPKGWFDPATTTEAVLLNNVKGMSAGITKIHSLIANELLIYDSRVACALAWLVDRYCDDLELTDIPEELRFCLPEPKKDKDGKLIRNPEMVRQRLGSRLSTKYKKPKDKDILDWTRDMLRTSLILSEVLKKLGKTTNVEGDTVVDPDEFLKYQLGLFMIGYHLGEHRIE